MTRPLATLLILTLAACANAQATKPKSVEIETKFSWNTFLQRHDIVWEVLPQRFDDGAFLGNGMLGSTIYKEGPNHLRWEMGRSDVTEHRRDNARLPIGGLVLTTVGKIRNGTMRTDLWNAEVRGTITTDKGTITFRSFIHTHEMVLITDIETTAGEEEACFAWDARPCIDHRNATRFKDPPNPPASTDTIKGISVCTQARFAGGEFATAWKDTPLNKGCRVIVSIADSFPGKTATQQAVTTVEKTLNTDFTVLLDSHRRWWHDFYPKSMVSVPDPKLESFYWIQFYKLASASRPHLVPVDLLGPWYRKTSWPRIWWNLNVETLYLPVYTGNRLELGESFINFIDAKRANFYRNARDIWGFDGCATVPHTTDYEGLRGDGSAAPDKYINPGDFTWALHNYYLQYRYSMDHSMVTDHSKHAFYPLLRDSINLYLKILTKGKDGKLHLPKLHSPEYGDDADNNYNLSLLRWGCQTLIKLNERYDLGDPLVPTWKKTLRDLVPYPVDENGLRIGADISYTKSHRHWSHILMIHPLHIMTTDQPENRALLEKSVLHWLTVGGSRGINGWSRAAAASLYATLGDGENAIDQIHQHMADKRFVRSNTMYIEGSPVIECSIVLNRSLQDMLLQSWGNIIEVFPAIPKAWDQAIFHDLRAEGAFLVSAERKHGKTAWVRIKSLAGEPCRIRPSIEGEVNVLKNGKMDKVIPARDGGIEIELKRGEEAVLFSGNEVPSLIVAPVPIAPEQCNAWGVKSVSTPKKDSTKLPDEVRAKEIMSMKFGMFICWSYSTFSGREWTPTHGKDASHFKATGCDTDQWCETAKAAGMNYILFLTKHHDGFCLWDTATTEKKVTNSPLGIDVLAKLRKSCDKYGIKLALYFSEGDWNWPGAKDGKGSRTWGGTNPEVKKAQLMELLTNYGPIEFWWMDHATGTGGLNHKDTVEWMHKFQPNTFVGFNHGEPAGRICLREKGGPGKIGDPKAVSPHNRGGETAHNYLVAEFTYPILPKHKGGAHWFYSLPKHDNLCHPVKKLFNDYVGAVKHENIFSINIGPNYEGQLRDIDVKTLRAVGEMIKSGSITQPPLSP